MLSPKICSPRTKLSIKDYSLNFMEQKCLYGRKCLQKSRKHTKKLKNKFFRPNKCNNLLCQMISKIVFKLLDFKDFKAYECNKGWKTTKST